MWGPDCSFPPLEMVCGCWVLKGPWWYQKIRKRNRNLLGSVFDWVEDRAPGKMGQLRAAWAWFGWSTLQLFCLL